MPFLLKNRDDVLGVLDIKGDSYYITKGILYGGNLDIVPLPLQNLFKNPEKYFKAKSTETEKILTYDGCSKVNEWLSDREIPLDRDNLRKYLADGNSARKWMVNNQAFSFCDNYWLCDVAHDMSFEEYLELFNDIDTFDVIANRDTVYGKENCTLGGKLEKFWFRSDGDVYLAKKNPPNLDVLSIREMFAHTVYEAQGIPSVEYLPVYNKEQCLCGCVCKSFTNRSCELITAYDILAANGETQEDDVYERIIARAVELGASEQKVRDYMDAQTIVDYLITNRDRHQGNIGFLRDSKTRQIISPAPIFDSGSSIYFENELPLSATNTTVNGLYKTEMECLSHVKNWSVIDAAKLPDRNTFSKYLNLSSELTESRKEKMLNLYEEKVTLFAKMQKEKLLQSAEKKRASCEIER